jgi:hypothetical protein
MNQTPDAIWAQRTVARLVLKLRTLIARGVRL